MKETHASKWRAAVCLALLVRFRRNLIPALASVIGSAFGVRPAAGGFAGAAMLAAMHVGTARGVYSNEAGVGSAPMAHACADTDDPVKQGLFGITEIFVVDHLDTSDKLHDLSHYFVIDL